MKTRTLTVLSPIAENKDWARNARIQSILPALVEGKPFTLDFSAVTSTTQSFIHACISQAVTELGEDALELLEFRACNPQVQNIIETVIEYSLRARTLTQQGLSSVVTQRDVPQADSLKLVRDVLESLASGDAIPSDIVATTGFSLRHVQYRLHAARILGLAQFHKNFANITSRGIELVRTPKDSPQERLAFERAIKESTIVANLAPNLLGERGPSLANLARRIEKKTGLSHSTSLRRAGTLLSWRRTIQQLRLL